MHASLHEAKPLLLEQLLRESNSRMASFTNLRATMLLTDSDPLSFVTKALFTENLLSGAALLWDSVNAHLATMLRCSNFSAAAVSTILETLQ